MTTEVSAIVNEYFCLFWYHFLIDENNVFLNSKKYLEINIVPSDDIPILYDQLL